MSAIAPVQAQKPAATTDLDAFMEKVLARREVNRATLKQYILDETETFEVLGPGKAPLYRTKRDYTWYVRDGMHVRSPVRMNGVGVGEKERDEYERNWIRHEKERQERAAKKQNEPAAVSISPGGVDVDTGGIPIPTEPRFVSEAYFMDFKFEPGNYLLAGREQLDGHQVLRIEYYPTKLFSDDEDRKAPAAEKQQRPSSDREQKAEADINRRMNKTALVTLWVDPEEHQIVKYTFDNIWMDFLPGAWLVRVDDLHASMTMGQPFPGVWLPHDMNIQAGFTLASGSYAVSYGRSYGQYREADVKSTIRVPKKCPDPIDEQQVDGHGPFAPDREVWGAPRGIDGQAEVLREVRVHGNAFLTDDEVLKLAAVAVGEPVTADMIEAVRKRLKDSARFDSIDVRKRYRSIDDPTDVALVLVVHEKPGVRSANAQGGVPSPMRRLTSRLMFLPILGYNDGYGFTYGARVSTVDLLGIGERLSVPGTWGGTKRIALEFERPFKAGPLTRITSSIAIWNRDNPHYDAFEDDMSIDEHRVEFKAGADRQVGHVLRTGVEYTRSSVEFLGVTDQLWTLGASASIDTRIDPAFPSNAVLLGAAWRGVNVKPGAAAQPVDTAFSNHFHRINTYTADARGYLRVVGQAVVAARAQYFTSDGPLPEYERWLLGGSPTLRGFHAGEFSADEMLVSGAELRVPITSVMHAAKFGLTIFYDAGKGVAHGTALANAPWEQGAGAGIFIIAPLVHINMDIAHGSSGDTRFHLTTGFVF